MAKSEARLDVQAAETVAATGAVDRVTVRGLEHVKKLRVAASQRNFRETAPAVAELICEEAATRAAEPALTLRADA